MAELDLEVLWGALESPRGTMNAVPTHIMTLEERTLTENQTTHSYTGRTGTRAEYTQHNRTYSDSTMEGSGALDLRQAPFWMSLACAAPTTTTPVGATNARLHSFSPGLSTDAARSCTWLWGDPNARVYRAPYHMLDELTIAFDAESDESVTFDVTTTGQMLEGLTAPTFTAITPPTATSEMLIPSIINADLWMDTGASAIGTTKVDGRLVSGEFRIVRQRSRKRHAMGLGAALTFDRTGFGRDHAELTLTFEFFDAAQYPATLVDYKTRLHLYGPLIEAGQVAFFGIDIYGPLTDPQWDEYMDTNRTLTVTILSTLNADARTAGADWLVRVKNATATV